MSPPTGHPSPQERNPEAFPVLGEAQIQAIAAAGQRRRFADGDAVWEIGRPMRSFFVVLRGRVEVYQISGTGEEHQVVVHEPGEFTGDIDLLSTSATVVGARARGVTEAIELPAERLRRLLVESSELSDVLLAAFLARRQDLIATGRGSLTLVGSRFSPDTFRIREFLERNSRPFAWIDIESDERVSRLLEGLGLGPEQTPIVIDADGRVTRNPSIEQMADCYGLSRVDEHQIYDLVVVGAGPAGLASAVYAASEGLRVLIVDAVAPGGQAGTSSKIENYLGFPTGISGRDLAQRAFVQATKFGAELAAPREVTGLDLGARPYTLRTGGGQSVRGRTIVIATGARYRRLPVDRARDFEGRGIYLGATLLEARMCAGQEVVVVGGGNSAGQAAVFLSQHAKRVHVVIRGESLEHSMSKYLIHRIEASPRISLHPFTEISGLHGDGALESVEISDKRARTARRMDIRSLFVFIGATPNTAWLPPGIARDAKGFIRTGRDLERVDLEAASWSLPRSPYLLETNLPGIFAAGDVRSGSPKRVASAVGEGSIAVSFIHQVLTE